MNEVEASDQFNIISEFESLLLQILNTLKSVNIKNSDALNGYDPTLEIELICESVLKVTFDTPTPDNNSHNNNNMNKLRLRLAAVSLSYISPAAKLFTSMNDESDDNRNESSALLKECVRVCLNVLNPNNVSVSSTTSPWSLGSIQSSSSTSTSTTGRLEEEEDTSSQAGVSCLATLMNKVCMYFACTCIYLYVCLYCIMIRQSIYFISIF